MSIHPVIVTAENCVVFRDTGIFACLTLVRSCGYNVNSSVALKNPRVTGVLRLMQA